MALEYEKIKQEMSDLQIELQKGLNAMLSEAGSKLSSSEKEAIRQEMSEITELVERLKSGLVWIALFGKTSVGKSAIANALIGEDSAKVGIEHDLTGIVNYYKKEPWNIGDVPGIMGKKVNEQIALTEARKAHGHIFVVDEEPFETEIELFDLVSKHLPKAPRIVFVNKYDRFDNMTSRDREVAIHRIKEKMRKYVKSENDIIFGSAALFDKTKDEMVRQKLTQLEDRLYADAGTLGQIVNVLDPAKRASDLASNIKNRILEIRKGVARKVIKGFAVAEIASSIVPFGSLVVTPGLLASLTYSLVKVMGVDNASFDKTKTAGDILKVCGQFLAADFVAVAAADVITDILGLGIFGILADLAGLSYFKYRRTLIFGEVVLLYIENGFTFGNDAKTMILKAKSLAQEKYASYNSKG